MRKQILITTLLVSLAAAPAFAKANPSKEENIGVGTGAVVGAIAGGPVGFVIGAAIGAKLGDTLHNKNSEIDTLAVSLQGSRSEQAAFERQLRQLNSDIDALSAELEYAESSAQPALVNLLQAGIAMDLLFRTDEHVLSDMTGSRLAELAGSVATMQNIRVQLDGFADERGDSDYNYKLSEKRVEFVRDQLISAGIDASRITIAAHGEAPAQDASADSFALERRVSLTLFIADSQSFASNPD